MAIGVTDISKPGRNACWQAWHEKSKKPPLASCTFCFHSALRRRKIYPMFLRSFNLGKRGRGEQHKQQNGFPRDGVKRAAPGVNKNVAANKKASLTGELLLECLVCWNQLLEISLLFPKSWDEQIFTTAKHVQRRAFPKPRTKDVIALNIVVKILASNAFCFQYPLLPQV